MGKGQKKVKLYIKTDQYTKRKCQIKKCRPLLMETCQMARKLFGLYKLNHVSEVVLSGVT